MKPCRIALALVLLALVAQGCAIIDYRPDPERTTYLVAKTAVWGLYRAGVSKDRLLAAKPHLEVLAVALEATNEVLLDATLAEYLDRYVAMLPEEADRMIVGDLIRAVLSAFWLQNPAILADKRKEVLVWIVGGLLDGIAYVEEAPSPE